MLLHCLSYVGVVKGVVFYAGVIKGMATPPSM